MDATKTREIDLPLAAHLNVTARMKGHLYTLRSNAALSSLVEQLGMSPLAPGLMQVRTPNHQQVGGHVGALEDGIDFRGRAHHRL